MNAGRKPEADFVEMETDLWKEGDRSVGGGRKIKMIKMGYVCVPISQANIIIMYHKHISKRKEKKTNKNDTENPKELENCKGWEMVQVLLYFCTMNECWAS